MGFEPTVRLPAQRFSETAPSQIGIGGRVNSRWLQVPATIKNVPPSPEEAVVVFYWAKARI